MRCKNCVTHDVWGYGRMYDSRFLYVRIAGHLMNLPVVIVNTSTGTCIYVQKYIYPVYPDPAMQSSCFAESTNEVVYVYEVCEKWCQDGILGRCHFFRRRGTIFLVG